MTFRISIPGLEEEKDGPRSESAYTSCPPGVQFTTEEEEEEELEKEKKKKKRRWLVKATDMLVQASHPARSNAFCPAKHTREGTR